MIYEVSGAILARVVFTYPCPGAKKNNTLFHYNQISFIIE